MTLQTKPIKNTLIICSIFSLCLTSFSIAAKDPESFLEVMQLMGKKYNEVSEGILKQDYAKLIAAADIIAEHPEPPLFQRLKIIAKLDVDFPDFKSWDDKVHLSAVALSKAAKEKDDNAILEQNALLLKNCTSCHSKYRTIIQSMNK